MIWIRAWHFTKNNATTWNAREHGKSRILPLASDHVATAKHACLHVGAQWSSDRDICAHKHILPGCALVTVRPPVLSSNH